VNAPVHPISRAPHPARIETPEFLPPGLPRQPTVEGERLYRKQRLAAAFRLFARWGYDFGGAGHITARDPGNLDAFWVNCAGVHFSRITTSHLMLVNHDGEILEGPSACPARLNIAAFAIHSELHRARPDVVAAAHTHSTYGKAWSALGEYLEPLSQDGCAFYQDHGLFREFSGVVNDTSEGEKIAQALGPHKAVILQNHGILTVGQTVEAAAWRYHALENACQIQLLAQAAGKTRPIPHKVALHTHGQIGTEQSNTRSFLPYWEVITEEEPDLCD